MEIRNVQIISLVLNKEMLCLAILKVKPYRTDLGTGCMRSRDYPVVKTSISFFLFLFFSLCVSELFFLEMRIVGHILRYFGPRIETKGKFTSLVVESKKCQVGIVEYISFLGEIILGNICYLRPAKRRGSLEVESPGSVN